MNAAVSTIDPTIRLKPCSNLINLVNQIDSDTTSLPQSLKNLNENSEIELSDVKYLHKIYPQLLDNEEKPFHELVAECELIIPSPKFPERNPELEARIQKLKADQANKEYEQMTQGLGKTGSPREKYDAPIGKQLKEINNYIILIFQLVVSVVASFATGYLAPFYFYGIADVGKRLIFALILAFIVAIADLYFIIRHYLEIEGNIDIEKMKKKYN